MRPLPWRGWTVQYVLPTLMLLGSLGIMFLFSDDPDMVWIFVVAPVVTFLTALVVQPERSWVTPMAVAMVLATVILVGALFDALDPRGHAVLGYVYTTVFVGLPLTVVTWVGKAVGTVYRDWRDERRFQAEWRDDRPSSSEGPHAPAH